MGVQMEGKSKGRGFFSWGEGQEAGEPRKMWWCCLPGGGAQGPREEGGSQGMGLCLRCSWVSHDRHMQRTNRGVPGTVNREGSLCRGHNSQGCSRKERKGSRGLAGIRLSIYPSGP